MAAEFLFVPFSGVGKADNAPAVTCFVSYRPKNGSKIFPNASRAKRAAVACDVCNSISARPCHFAGAKAGAKVAARFDFPAVARKTFAEGMRWPVGAAGVK